jgi:arsenate reductase (glutaredoxin)
MVSLAFAVSRPSPFDRLEARRLCLSKTGREESMERVTLYHNPACSNSRGALQMLRDRKVEFDLVEYLKTPPDRAALEKILSMLETPPADLVRKDKRFEELKLKAEDYTAREKVVALLVKHPELMQRPVVIRGNRAVIARPPEKLDTLL